MKYNLSYRLNKRFLNHNKLLKYCLMYLFAFSVSFIILYVMNYLEGTLYMDGLKVGYLEDYVSVVNVGVLGFPLLWILSYVYANRLEFKIYEVRDSQSIKIDEKIFKQIYQDVKRLIDSGWVFIAILSTAIIANLVLWVLPHTHETSTNWFFNDNSRLLFNFSYSGFFYFILMVLYYYLFLYLVYYLVIVSVFLKKIATQSTLIINPLHPDKCGGLQAIGNLALFMTTPLIIFVGFSIAVMIYTDYSVRTFDNVYYVYVFTIAAFISMSALFTFMPLFWFRAPMLQSKFETLHRVGNSYNDLYYEIVNDDLLSVDPKKVESLDLINRVYDKASSMPIWPFNIDQIFRFLYSTISPFIIFLIQKFIESLI